MVKSSFSIGLLNASISAGLNPSETSPSWKISAENASWTSELGQPGNFGHQPLGPWGFSRNWPWNSWSHPSNEANLRRIKSPHLSARPAGNAPTARSNALVGYLWHDDQQISQIWWFSGKRWCKLARDWIFMLFLRQFNIRWQQKKWQTCIVTSIFWTVSLLNWGKYLNKAN